eukprot:10334373-Alexandrium_andersonii.AAC.1
MLGRILNVGVGGHLLPRRMPCLAAPLACFCVLCAGSGALHAAFPRPAAHASACYALAWAARSPLGGLPWLARAA